MVEEFQEGSGCRKGCGCLLTLVVFGLLVLVALPPFMVRVGRSPRYPEAKNNVGSMNRAQQVYFLENNAFTNKIAQLGLGIATETENYKYSIRTADKAAFHYGIARVKIKSYVGGVFVNPATQVPHAPKGEMTMLAILCESAVPSSTKPADPILQNGVPTCGNGTIDLTYSRKAKRWFW